MKEAEDKGWLRIKGCGGIDELLKCMQEGEGQPRHHLRWWYTSDRDSGEVGGLSRPAQELQALCQAQRPPIPYGPLSRRMSESYLPLPLIALWAQRGGRVKRKQRQAIYAELSRMPSTLRHRFEMKRGFLWSLSDERCRALRRLRSKVTQDEVFAAFSDVARSASGNPEQQYLNALSRDPERLLAMQFGLGSEIGEIFDMAPEQELDVWMSHEVNPAERFDLIQSILDRV